MEENKQTNGFCIAGFIVSFFLVITGLILSIIGVSQCKKTGEKGRGLGIAGIVISSVKIVYTIIITIIIITLGTAFIKEVGTYINNYHSDNNSSYCMQAFDCHNCDKFGYCTCSYCKDNSCMELGQVECSKKYKEY